MALLFLLAIMTLNGLPNFHDLLLFIDEISSSKILLCSQNHMEGLLECMSLGSPPKGSDCMLDQGPMLRTTDSSEDNDIWFYYFIVDAERAKISESRIFLIFKLEVSCPGKPVGPSKL